MKISQEVMNVLDAATVDGNSLVLAGTLDRRLYTETNKVLEAIGGQWNRKAKAHIFTDLVVDVLDPIMLTGEYSRTKQDFGQFDTPIPLVIEIINAAEIVPGMTVYEPSAGLGNFVRILRTMGVHYFANELDAKRFEELQSNFFPGGGVSNKDFLAIDSVRNFDRIVMNPPFAKQADIDHVMHAFNFLKPGGILVSIMSSSVMHRENKKTMAFREFVADHGSAWALPAESFKASGTSVSTCAVKLLA